MNISYHSFWCKSSSMGYLWLTEWPTSWTVRLVGAPTSSNWWCLLLVLTLNLLRVLRLFVWLMILARQTDDPQISGGGGGGCSRTRDRQLYGHRETMLYLDPVWSGGVYFFCDLFITHNEDKYSTKWQSLDLDKSASEAAIQPCEHITGHRDKPAQEPDILSLLLQYSIRRNFSKN